VDSRSYEEGQRIRAEQQAVGFTYRPRHSFTDQQSFLRDNLLCMNFHSVHPQEMNPDFAYRLFAIPCQHVYGNSLEELLDKAIDASLSERNHG
jgi:hypothetical protein